MPLLLVLLYLFGNKEFRKDAILPQTCESSFALNRPLSSHPVEPMVSYNGLNASVKVINDNLLDSNAFDIQ
jgi:hypothetical protein